MKKNRLINVITFRLILVVVATCVISLFLMYRLLYDRTVDQARKLIGDTVEDISVTEENRLTDNMAMDAQTFTTNTRMTADSENWTKEEKTKKRWSHLIELVTDAVYENNIVDDKEIILDSFFPQLIGRNIHEDELSYKTILMPDGKSKGYIRTFQSKLISDSFFIYVGAPFTDGSG